MISELFKRKEAETRFLAVEKLALLYNLFTTILIVVFFNRLANPQGMLLGRFVILVGTFTLIYIYIQSSLQGLQSFCALFCKCLC